VRVTPLLRIAVVILAGASACLAANTAPPVSEAEAQRADRIVGEALAKSYDAIEQSRNLVALAWPDGKRDEVVAARARRELGDFGGHGMVALHEAINTVKPAYAAEVVRTILTASAYTRGGQSPEYIPALLDVLWVDNREARAAAIQPLVAVRPILSVQWMIDIALEDKELEPQIVAALGAMRFEQARFYLEKVMMEGPPALRPVAAASLTQIGGAALGPLKNALKAPNKETRILAARALLPAATDHELGAIYDYIRDHGDDDPAVTQALKASAINIEKAIAARDAAAAAGAPKDF
jgi:hypothetical protein